GGIGQAEEEGLVVLVIGVAIDEDGDGLACLAGGEGDRAVGFLVVGAGFGGVVGRRIGDVDRLAAGAGASDREDGVLGAGVAFGDAHITDGNRRLWIVIDDGYLGQFGAIAGYRTATQIAAADRREGDIDRLVILVDLIIDDVDYDGLAALAV